MSEKTDNAESRRRWRSDLAPPLRDPQELNPDGQALYAEYANQRFGKLLVLGLGVGIGSKGRNWIVRCDCGFHENRSAKELYALSDLSDLSDKDRRRYAACEFCQAHPEREIEPEYLIRECVALDVPPELAMSSPLAPSPRSWEDHLG